MPRLIRAQGGSRGLGCRSGGVKTPEVDDAPAGRRHGEGVVGVLRHVVGIGQLDARPGRLQASGQLATDAAAVGQNEPGSSQL